MKRTLLFAIAAISLSILLSSCMARRGETVVTGSNGENLNTKYHYWYYPNTQVYFDSERKVYYYPENGGWNQSMQLPATFSADASYVVVDENSDKPYTNHDKHMKQYPSQSIMNNHEKKVEKDNWDANAGKDDANRENK